MNSRGLKGKGNEVEVFPYKEILKEKDKKTIITYSVETRRIEIMTAVQVKKALKPIWQNN